MVKQQMYNSLYENINILFFDYINFYMAPGFLFGAYNGIKMIFLKPVIVS